MNDRRAALPIVILGAGLSGLSLACALLEENVSAPIVLVDRRSTWDHDRTWCTWATEPTRFSELARHRWPTWRFAAGGREVLASSAEHPYLHFDSRDIYRDALRRLGAAPNVEVRPRETVHGVFAGQDRPVVETSTGAIEASSVFDALGPTSPLLRGQPRGDVELVQSFLGWEVELDVPVFDPEIATLMDFRGDGRDGLRFLYVLPFSNTRALIEDTSIGREAPALPERRRMLEEELRGRLGVQRWQVVHEERGRLPMTTRNFELRHGPRVHSVGAAAGAIRPSSGYAFSRIQRHCSQVASAFARSGQLPPRVASTRVTTLDAIFLRAMDAEPERFPEIFLRLAAGVPGDVFARFMTDLSTPTEDAQVIAALPKGPFLSALLRSSRAAATHAITPSRRRHRHTGLEAR